MLIDLIDAVVYAKSKNQREIAYRNLEKVGMDKATATMLVIARRMELIEKSHKKVVSDNLNTEW